MGSNGVSQGQEKPYVILPSFDVTAIAMMPPSVIRSELSIMKEYVGRLELGLSNSIIQESLAIPDTGQGSTISKTHSTAQVEKDSRILGHMDGSPHKDSGLRKQLKQEKEYPERFQSTEASQLGEESARHAQLENKSSITSMTPQEKKTNSAVLTNNSDHSDNTHKMSVTQGSYQGSIKYSKKSNPPASFMPSTKSSPKSSRITKNKKSKTHYSLRRIKIAIRG